MNRMVVSSFGVCHRLNPSGNVKFRWQLFVFPWQSSWIGRNSPDNVPTGTCCDDLSLVIDSCYFHSAGSLLFHGPVLWWDHFYSSLIPVDYQLRWYVMSLNHPFNLWTVGVLQFGNLSSESFAFVCVELLLWTNPICRKIETVLVQLTLTVLSILLCRCCLYFIAITCLLCAVMIPSAAARTTGALIGPPSFWRAMM